MDLSRYNITGEKEAAEAAAKNNARLIFIRWPYTLLIFSVAIATAWLAGNDSKLLPQYIVLFGVGLLINGFFAAVVRIFRNRLSTQHVLTGAQLIFDIIMAGVATYIQGGAEARTTVLFVFPIMAAGLIFGGQAVTLAAVLSGAGYIAAILLHLYIVDASVDTASLLVPMIFYPAVFLLIGRVVRYLQHLGAIEVREKAYNSFLSLLAHQLKHPASAVTTIIDAINHNDEGSVDETTRRYIEMLKTENEDQIRLIDNLLEAAPHQKAASFVQDLDVAALVEKIARRLAENNERLSDLQPLLDTAAKVLADVNPIRLSLALTNLLDNAFRYSRPGDVVQYGISETSDAIKILIRDNGQGMDEGEIAHQFERFATEGIRGIEQGHVGGLGLGLYASAQIARAHDGSLDIDSAGDKGTTIILTLKKEHRK